MNINPPVQNRSMRSGRFIREDNRFTNVAGKSGLKTEDELKSFIHEGQAFGIDADGTLLNAASLLLLGITGDREVHFLAIEGDWSAGGVRYELFEEPTTTADGTPVTPYALNRALVNAATLSVYSAPTVTDDGIKIAQKYIPSTGVGGNVQAKFGGIAGGRVLKKNTKYLIKLTNESGDTVTHGHYFVWGEALYDV